MWTIAIYELKQLLRTKSVMALLILAPLVLIFILGSALSEVFQPQDSTIEAVTVAYYDEDQGQLSQDFETFLMEQENYLIPVPAGSRDEVLRKLKSKEAHLGLYIPKGFSQAAMEGKEAGLELIPGTDNLKSKVGMMIIQSFINEANFQQASAIVLGPSALAGNSTQAGTEPETSYVEAGRLGKAGTEYSAMQYYASAMLVMFLLYSGLTAAISLLKEKETHTLSRLQSTPVHPSRVIIGKLIGNSFLSALQAAVIILITIWVYGADWGDSILYIFLICLGTILASMGMAFIVAFLFKSTKSVAGAFAAFIGFMTFASGGMMPTEGTFLENIKPFTVNYWASNSFIRLMTGQDYAGVINNISILAMLGCAFILIASVLYRKVGYHE